MPRSRVSTCGRKPASRSNRSAESGGNCEATRPGETVETGGVTVAGPLDLASSGAVHASEMYARNLFNFTRLLLVDGGLAFDWEDELLAKTVWPEPPVSPREAAAAASPVT